jgi:hypothetical protein
MQQDGGPAMEVKHLSSNSELVLHRAATDYYQLFRSTGMMLLRIKAVAATPAAVELTVQLKYVPTGLLVGRDDPQRDREAGEWEQSSGTYVVEMDDVSTVDFSWIWISLRPLGWGRKWNQIHLSANAPVTYILKEIALCPSCRS